MEGREERERERDRSIKKMKTDRKEKIVTKKYKNRKNTGKQEERAEGRQREREIEE